MQGWRRQMGYGLLALLVQLAIAAPVHAALGETIAVPDETTTLRAAGQRLTVRTRGGVREFAAEGKIFAVKWSGRFAPNLRTLLGPYLAEYEQALRTRARAGHGYLMLHTPSLEIRAFSRARRAEGAVWIVAQLPKGVTVDALP